MDFPALNQIRHLMWRDEVGPEVDLMLSSRNETHQRLSHSDPKVRRVALAILLRHWNAGGDVEIKQWCEKMASGDPDPQTRAVAVSSLAQCHKDSKDARIGRILASIVRNEMESCEIRNSAYSGLFSLRGLSGIWAGELDDPPTDFRFPEDVDWLFVDSFFDPQSSYEPPDPLDALCPPLSEDDQEALSSYEKGVQAFEGSNTPKP